MDIKCAVCGLRPDEIEEYVDEAEMEEMTPEEFVISEEGTFNPKSGKFYCTDDYISIGMPLGTAP